jgi:Zn-dependent protease with chaperone function
VKELSLTILLALAWFAVVNLVLSTLVAAGSPLLVRAALRQRPSRAPAVLLTVKLVPGVVTLLFILVVFLPAQWRFEPKNADESAGYTLVALGLLGALILALAARRAARDWRATRSLERQWLASAAAAPLPAANGLPTFCLPGGAPIVSLTGVRRPRVFVSRPVLEALTDEELDASLAHERAHHQTRDNLKRLLVACSPDLLGLWPAGRDLERRWREAVEFAADARAVSGTESRRLLLASALLKVARMTSAAGMAATWSGFYDGAPIGERVRRLLSPDVGEEPASRLGRAWSISLCGVTLLAAASAAEGAWLGVHVATEGLIRLLP